MKPMHIAMALLSAAMFFVLAGVFMGVQLELDGTKLVVDTASDIRWQWVFIGTAVVFFFQLVRPAFQKGLKSVSGPKFILPAIDGSTVKQKAVPRGAAGACGGVAVYGVAWDGGYRHSDHDLHYSRPRAERGCWSFWSAGAGVWRLLRHRRLHLCAAQSLLRLWASGLVCRLPG